MIIVGYVGCWIPFSSRIAELAETVKNKCGSILDTATIAGASPQ
jgi:hypothetical protein